MSDFDMHVDYDSLCVIEDKLQKIEYDIECSTEKMADAIVRSEGFLAGNQFEKAKHTTMECLAMTRRTQANIRYAKDYIIRLMEVLGEYGTCGYDGGNG